MTQKAFEIKPDPDLISNAFCEFLSNTGCKLQENIPFPRTNYEDQKRKAYF